MYEILFLSKYRVILIYNYKSSQAEWFILECEFGNVLNKPKVFYSGIFHVIHIIRFSNVINLLQYYSYILVLVER